MTIRVEHLTWEVLDYWKASGLPFGPTIPGTTVVARNKQGFYWTGPSSDLRYSAFSAGVPVKIVVMGWKDPRK